MNQDGRTRWEADMSEIKKRTKKDPPPVEETAASPPRQTRVTLTKDVSSRYRKLVPRARAGGSAKSRPPRSQGPAAPPERNGAPPKPPRRNDSPGSGPSEAMKALINRELPEAARQIRETQDLLRTTAEESLTLLEGWESLPHKEIRATRAMVNALFEKMSFQDLAGQRLAKVETFLKALGEIVAASAGPSRPPDLRGENLKGPQAAGGGLDQKEIEALLADLQGPRGPSAPGPQARRAGKPNQTSRPGPKGGSPNQTSRPGPKGGSPDKLPRPRPKDGSKKR